jgi:hypothetical protein
MQDVARPAGNPSYCSPYNCLRLTLHGGPLTGEVAGGIMIAKGRAWGSRQEDRSESNLPWNPFRHIGFSFFPCLLLFSA